MNDRPLLPSGGKRQAVQSSCVPVFNPGLGQPGQIRVVVQQDQPRPPGTLDGPEAYGFSGRARASAAAAQPLAATAMNWSLP
jgi:hypothetical protein